MNARDALAAEVDRVLIDGLPAALTDAFAECLVAGCPVEDFLTAIRMLLEDATGKEAWKCPTWHAVNAWLEAWLREEEEAVEDTSSEPF